MPLFPTTNPAAIPEVLGGNINDQSIPGPSSILPGIGSTNTAAPTLTPLHGSLPWAEGYTSTTFNNEGTTSSSTKSSSAINSAFFPPLAPRGELWDKLVPYRILVIDTSKNNQVVNGSTPSKVSVVPLGNGTISFTALTNAWEFFLPITPQQLSITDAYSINTSATLRGILEEHSGVRFKNISVQGTFGVWPQRDSILKSQPATPSILQSVFGGTIAAAQNVATQFASIVNNLTTGSNAAKPTTVRPENQSTEDNGLGTGYYQTLMLTQFLEQYAEAKRNPVNAGWRLVFDIPKQNQSFVVTPVAFTWNENVNRPMEINYSLQFKAWRRINLNDRLIQKPSTVVPISPGILQNIINTISAAQNTAAAAVNLIGSVRSDVDNILNIIRQTGLLVKGLAGVAIAVSDLPSQIVGDAKSTISQFCSTLDINNLTGASATDLPTTTTITNMKVLNATNEGLSSTAVSNGQIGPSAAVSATLNPSNVVFANPLQYPLLFNQVPVSSLTLNTAQQSAVQTEINRVNDFTIADLRMMRETILTLCIQLSNSFGAGNAYYDTLFNQPAPIMRNVPMTLDEYDTLQSFYDLLQTYDILTATNQFDNAQALNTMEYVNALAATSNIPFSISNSKIQVPVPFGLTIEQIAMRYLGDPMRWLEIATLNELREPYIDENGFVLPLLSNADGRNIVISSTEDLFIGQTVFLNSNTQPATARKIINIVTLSQTSFLLTLDGLANLGVFTIADSAFIQAYLPGTTNSQNVIWMPSDLPAPLDDQISVPSSVANVKLVGLSKVDWLLTPQGDLATDGTASFRLSAGLTNLVQALGIKFGTTKGTSLLDPGFGLGVKSGTMVSDINSGDIYNEITNLVTADTRFSGVSGLQVTLQPPSLGINLGVGLAGQRGVFPVSFNLPSSS